MKYTKDNSDDIYIRSIQENTQSGFNRIIPIGAIVLFISAATIFFSSLPIWFVYLDIVLGVTLVIMTIIKKRISISVKIFTTVLISLIIGVSSFLDGGFNSSGITLILLADLIAVMLLHNIINTRITILSVGIFIVLWVINKTFQVDKFSYIKDAEWIIQFSIFILFLLVIRILVRSVRDYLITNIKKVEKSKEQIYKLAYYDSLTGLPNNNSFKKELRERDTEQITSGFLIIYNIRNLNIIDAIYGEEISNQVIIAVGNIFDRLKKNADLMAVTERNKFILWLESISEEQLSKWFSQTNKAIEENILPVTGVKPEFYIGCSSYKTGDQIINDCYKQAKLALTYAKTNNISGIVNYNNELEENLCNEENFKELLLDAINKKEFDIHYQPKVDVSTGKIVGVEALARWYSDSLGYVGPNIFIPFIEKINLSIVFGQFVIDKVLADYKNICEKYNKDIQVAINISPSHLLSHGFIKYLKGKIQQYYINTDKIIIEITEEVLIQGKEYANEVIKEIRNLGINVSLDDFGSGYSSYNYLMNLDINELKIDRSFINQLLDNDKTSILLESIIYVAKNYNLTLVAEGVETKEQRDRLIELGCHIMQGYYFAKPKPL